MALYFAAAAALAAQWLASAARPGPADALALALVMGFMSAGAGNRYGFPHAEVRRRYHRSGARVLSTALWGAVSVGISHRGIDVDRAQRR
ncbi:MAG: hypothetical protein VCA74_07385 [Deltaproteobacteria bacterium]